MPRNAESRLKAAEIKSRKVSYLNERSCFRLAWDYFSKRVATLFGHKHCPDKPSDFLARKDANLLLLNLESWARTISPTIRFGDKFQPDFAHADCRNKISMVKNPNFRLSSLITNTAPSIKSAIYACAWSGYGFKDKSLSRITCRNSSGAITRKGLNLCRNSLASLV